MAETFGNGLGVLVLAIIVAVLDRRHRLGWLGMLASAWGAGMAANVLKLIVARTRPAHFDFQAGELWDSFGRWLPLVQHGHVEQSFPSAHTATAVGLAIALARLFPHGRWLFAVLAALVAAQRVAVGAHYVSDTLVGAAVGWLVGYAIVRLLRQLYAEADAGP